MSEQSEFNPISTPLICSLGGHVINKNHIDYWKNQTDKAIAEIARLQAANLAALKLADERTKEAAELRAQLASSTREPADATDDLLEKGK